VVDEDPLVRWSVVRFLETHCQEARSVASGELALALLREWPVDLLIADLRSGGGEWGFVDHCQRLRPRPRIILLTAAESHPRPADLERLGVVGMIEKPFVIPRLAQVLAGLLPKPGEAA
jgi:CheY-like chemotaxis protein